ncbi:MAG: RidA family protein [Variovorax sp.]
MKTVGNIVLPAGIAAPVGPYSHGVRVAGTGMWLHIAGQIGLSADGRVAEGFEAQAHQAWANLTAVLNTAGMDVSHLVKVSTYLTNSDDLKKLGPIRANYLGEARPASTLIVVQALAHPSWCFEVEACAFREA